ncbi:DoxX family protein [Marinobacteraceae bacterium S3BR75-40.1]
MFNAPDIAKLLLRITLGCLILLHGINKLIHGIGGIEAMVAQHGIPAFFAFGVYIGEVVAPLMIILGISTRVGAGLIAFNMFIAILLVHLGQLAQLGPHGGWAIELQAMFLVTAIAIALLGPGRWRLHS